MSAFFTANLSTIIVSAIVLVAVVLAITKMAKDKKKGKSCGCGSACEGCPSSSACHQDK